MKIVSKKQESRYIILEGTKRSLLPELKEVKEYSKQLQKRTKEQFGMNFKFLITWGAAIGGLMMPIETFIKSGNFNLSEKDVLLILIGVGSILFYENEEKIKKLIKEIDEKGLIETFTETLKKGEKLKSAFFSFIDSLNVTTHTLTNILSYAFVIPILPMLLDFANAGFSPQQLKELLLRVTYFTSIAVSGLAVKELIEKIIKRFRG